MTTAYARPPASWTATSCTLGSTKSPPCRIIADDDGFAGSVMLMIWSAWTGFVTTRAYARPSASYTAMASAATSTKSPPSRIVAIGVIPISDSVKVRLGNIAGALHSTSGGGSKTVPKAGNGDPRFAMNDSASPRCASARMAASITRTDTIPIIILWRYLRNSAVRTLCIQKTHPRRTGVEPKARILAACNTFLPICNGYKGS